MEIKKIFSQKEKIFDIITFILILASILTFELGYCNAFCIRNGITQEYDAIYHFSLCRVIVYIVFIIVYFIFRKGFIKEALNVFNENKYKRIFIYLTIPAIILSIIFGIVECKMDLYLIRPVAIGLITIFLGTILIMYLSNNVIRNFILVCSTMGIIFTFTTSYNHAIDEKKHFMSAFNLSFLNFDYANNPKTDMQVEALPQLNKFTNIDGFLEKYTPNLTNEVNKEDVPSLPAGYVFVDYLFPAVGIFIARLLGGSIIDMYILGRIMNLILYAVLVCFALKIIPYKKNILFVVASIPFMILLSASYSIDGFCIGSTFLFIAYCLKVYKEDEIISLKHFLALIGFFVLMLFAKSMAYILVGFIVFMLPFIKTLKKNKKYLPIIGVIGVIALILMVLLVVYIKNTKFSAENVDTRGSSAINPSEQIKVLMTQPVHTIKLLFNHFKGTFLCFAWCSYLHQITFFTENSEFVVLPLLCYLFYIALTETDFIFKLKDKIIMIISMLMVWAMTSLVLYVSFTEVGAGYIAGYQTRYIVPVLPLLLFAVANKKVKVTETKNRTMNIAIASSVFILVGIAQLIVV